MDGVILAFLSFSTGPIAGYAARYQNFAWNIARLVSQTFNLKLPATSADGQTDCGKTNQYDGNVVN